MKILPLAPVLALTLASCANAQTNKPTDKPLYSFEDPAEIAGARLKSTVAKLVTQGATQGQRALSVTFQPTTTFPAFNLPIEKPLDWTGAGALAFDVFNPGAEPVSFAMRIDSAAAVGTRGKSNSRTAGATVAPGKSVTLLMPFNVEMRSPDMSVLPGYTPMKSSGAWSPFDITQIAAAQIFVNKPTTEQTLIFDNLRLVAALPAPPPIPLKTDTKQLLSFENPAEVESVKTTSASAKMVAEGATEGKNALEITLEPTTVYPKAEFPFQNPQDFRGYGGLAFDLKNPTDETVRFNVRVDSAPDPATKRSGARSGGSSLEAGESASFVLPFGTDAEALGMKGTPQTGNGDLRNLGGRGRGDFDLEKIATWQIFLANPTRPQTLILDNVRVIPGQKEDFTKLVDRYGQYTRADWPGKIKSEADFVAQLQAEAADLKAHPPSPDLDQYGGWKAGPQLKATGFFRVEKYQEKWAFVDPEGHLFLSFGPDTVQPHQATKLTGREAMFETLPKDDPKLAQFVSEDKTQLDIYGANLERKYGADFQKAWLEQTYRRLPSWGFNTIGAFSSFDTKANGKVPYTVILWPGKGHASIFLEGKNLDDPYDPKFAADFNKTARNFLRNVVGDPYCVGIFVGNEERWGDFRNASPRAHYALILAALQLKADASPAKRAMVEQLKAKYGEIARLNAAWKTQFASWDAMNGPIELKDPLGAPLTADLSLLLKDYAQRYYGTIQAELKKVAPNHLYLGGRFAAYNPEVVEAAAKYTDVMSFNIYRTAVDPKAWTILEPYDHPVLIGEFHFGATDRGMFFGGLVGVADQNARAQAYQTYIRSVVDNPKFVGAHWFQYADQPTLGRPSNGENGNVGFVSNVDTPFPELIAAARQVHGEMYTRRWGAK